MVWRDYQDRVPSGRENRRPVARDSHLRIKAGPTLVQYSAISASSIARTSAGIPTATPSRYNPNWGFLIAISTSATGGGGGQPYPWVSPTATQPVGHNVILADANHWGSDGLIAVPQHARGEFIKTNIPTSTARRGRRPWPTAPQGGNVGALDGSVVWKSIRQMRTNQASSYVFYYGNW